MNRPSLKTWSLGLVLGSVMSGAYAEAPEEAWVAIYNGPGNGKDNAQALAVDAAGNAYVTGFSDGGDGNYDFATVKYDADGKQVWVARYDGEAQAADWVKAVAVGADGSVVVTGSSTGKDSGFDFATVKYDAEGNQLWVSRYDGPAQGDDRAKALAVDTAGNVYVTGDSPGDGGKAASVTIKYAPDGDLLWAARAGSPGDPSLADIAVDSVGNVYVTGQESARFVTIKFDPAGKVLWTANPEWSEKGDGRFLALDVEGNVYVTGAGLRRTEGAEGSANEDMVTVKYAPDGREVWRTSFNGGGGSDDVASALGVHQDGHAYVVGTSYGTDSAVQHVAIKYATGGDLLWSKPLRAPGGVGAAAHAAAVDESGSGVYVLGSEGGAAGARPRLLTVKLGPDGSERWSVGHAGTATGGAGALAVDAAGTVWVTGSDVAGQDFLTVKCGQSATEPEAPAEAGG